MTSTAVPTSGQARINHKRNLRAAFWNPAAQTVWAGLAAIGDPSQRDAAYQSRVVDWLRANGIDTSRVDGDGLITTSDRKISFTEFRHNEKGRAFLDGRGRLAVQARTVPLQVEFQPPTQAAPVATITTDSPDAGIREACDCNGAWHEMQDHCVSWPCPGCDRICPKEILT